MTTLGWDVVVCDCGQPLRVDFVVADERLPDRATDATLAVVVEPVVEAHVCPLDT